MLILHTNLEQRDGKAWLVWRFESGLDIKKLCQLLHAKLSPESGPLCKKKLKILVVGVGVCLGQ